MECAEQISTQANALSRHRPTRIGRSLPLLAVIMVETMETLTKMINSCSTLPLKITPLDHHVMLVHAMSIASTAVRAGQKETLIVTSQLIKHVGAAQEKSNSSMEMNVKQTLVAQTAQSAERAGPSMIRQLDPAMAPADVCLKKKNTSTNGRKQQTRNRNSGDSAMDVKLASGASRSAIRPTLTGGVPQQRKKCEKK